MIAPKRSELMPCKECKNVAPQVYKDCEAPCGWAISWLAHESRWQTIKDLLKVRWEE